MAFLLINRRFKSTVFYHIMTDQFGRIVIRFLLCFADVHSGEHNMVCNKKFFSVGINSGNTFSISFCFIEASCLGSNCAVSLVLDPDIQKKMFRKIKMDKSLKV